MTYRYIVGLLLLASLGACRKQPDEQPTPEYADWYAIKAPEARDVEAVTGDIDGTLILTTRYNIYRTTDRGKTWQRAKYSGSPAVMGFTERRDTLFTLTSVLQRSGADTATAYAIFPLHYSADQGRNWQEYTKDHTLAFYERKVPRNRVRTPSGTTYRLYKEKTPVSPGSTSAYITGEGIKPDVGSLIKLPQEHQLNSIYLDSKARLYVAASAPLCGRGKDFASCGAQNGVLYVSKKPLP